MPDLPSLFPLLLAAHIVLAFALLVPSLILPFTFPARALESETGPVARSGPVVRALLWLHGRGSAVIGAGLLATGIALLAVLGPRLLGQPWLAVSLVAYAATAVVAFAFQRPGLRSLRTAGNAATEAGRRARRARARRQRYIAYAMSAAVGLIAFLMATKPALW